MSEDQHKSELTGLIKEIMSDIDSKPLHPKNKILLYSRHVLPKISWHLTVSSLSKTWVTETIDSLVNSYIRKWLQIPISGTLSSIFLTRNKLNFSSAKPFFVKHLKRLQIKILMNYGNQPVTTKIFSMMFLILPSKY